MQKEKLLEQIAKQVVRCQACRLYRTRNKAVPGEGDINSDIAFIGEGPGYNEDQLGRPFVGRAGDLLDVLLRSIGTRRERVWISNVVKCRPPENRAPMVDEIRACKQFLLEQLKSVKPKMIVPLGRFAMELFFPDGKISRDHGKPFFVGGKIIYPLYHPAAALRSEAVLTLLKAEFRRIPAILKMDPKEMTSVNKKNDNADQMMML